MAVAFDAASSLGTTNTGGDSFTHTPVGTPTAVVVTLLQGGARNPSVTYGGQAMTLIHSVSPDASTIIYHFGLANPPSGAQTVAASWLGTIATVIGCITFTGSALTFGSAFGARATNSGISGNASVSLLNVSAGNLAIASVGNDHAVVAGNAAAWTAASPGTERWNTLDPAVDADAAAQTAAGPGTIPFSWTNNNSGVGDTSWGLVAVEVSAPYGRIVLPTMIPT